MAKTFRLQAHEIKLLATARGACIASDGITVDGARVGYMCREEPDNDVDSGFMAGDETDDCMDNASNHAFYDVNTIANYDPGIVPLLGAPKGSAFARKRPGGPLEDVSDEGVIVCLGVQET